MIPLGCLGFLLITERENATILTVKLNLTNPKTTYCVSINRIRDLKENYFILENCKNKEVIIEKCREYGILTSETRYLF